MIWQRNEPCAGFLFQCYSRAENGVASAARSSWTNRAPGIEPRDAIQPARADATGAGRT